MRHYRASDVPIYGREMRRVARFRRAIRAFVEAAARASPRRDGQRAAQPARALHEWVAHPMTKERIHMNWDRIEGNWKQIKGKARQKWGELTDDDLDKLRGKKDELVGKLQERKGIERDKAEREVNEWARSLDESI
jgi:uncharacterized protein YjbJ (UPF0337 family)